MQTSQILTCQKMMTFLKTSKQQVIKAISMQQRQRLHACRISMSQESRRHQASRSKWYLRPKRTLKRSLHDRTRSRQTTYKKKTWAMALEKAWIMRTCPPQWSISSPQKRTMVLFWKHQVPRQELTLRAKRPRSTVMLWWILTISWLGRGLGRATHWTYLG